MQTLCFRCICPWDRPVLAPCFRLCSHRLYSSSCPILYSCLPLCLDALSLDCPSPYCLPVLPLLKSVGSFCQQLFKTAYATETANCVRSSALQAFRSLPLSGFGEGHLSELQNKVLNRKRWTWHTLGISLAHCVHA